LHGPLQKEKHFLSILPKVRPSMKSNTMRYIVNPVLGAHTLPKSLFLLDLKTNFHLCVYVCMHIICTYIYTFIDLWASSQ